MTMEDLKQDKLPIVALVIGVKAVVRRNPMVMVRAGLFPFLLLFVIGLWQTPESWGKVGYHAMRSIEWVLVLGLWTFYAVQLQRYVLKGAMGGAASFLPKLNKREGRFALASIMVLSPLSLFAFWYDQTLFFNQPDLVLMTGLTAMDGTAELLYSSLFLGWLTQLFAFVLPAIAEDDKRSLPELFQMSFASLRQDFSRLFAASLLVVLPVWLLVAILRFILHMPFFTQMALADDASGIAWNLIFYALETLKVFVSGGLLAMLWALAYGRMRGRTNDIG